MLVVAEKEAEQWRTRLCTAAASGVGPRRGGGLTTTALESLLDRPDQGDGPNLSNRCRPQHAGVQLENHSLTRPSRKNWDDALLELDPRQIFMQLLYPALIH